MTQIPPIQTEMEKASALLSAATDLMNSGRLVSIASLKNMIDTICLLAKEEGYAQCALVKPLMTELSEKMDLFSQEMTNKYGFLNSTETDQNS